MSKREVVKSSIIIPAYYIDQSYVDLTKKCVESLVKYGKPDEIIVVDDGSPFKFDYKHWMLNYPGARAVILGSNQGYGGAVNAGLEVATGDVLIISNNDILFTPGWLEAILLPLEKGYDISSIRTTDNSGYDTEDKITEGDKFGSLWAMRRTVYARLRGFDLRFGRGYFEDTDYRRRAMEAGFRVGKNHNHLVEHFGRATFDTVDPDREFYAKNIRVYGEKWGTVD